eukprot:Clim_evm68s108 gene=Clim_evmTU68s108
MATEHIESVLKAALGAAVDESVLSYVTSIAEEYTAGNMDDEEFHDSLGPMLLEFEAAEDEATAEAMTQEIMKNLKADENATAAAVASAGHMEIKKLDAPVLMAKSSKEFTENVTKLLYSQLGLKDDRVLNTMITTWTDPNAVGDDEDSMALRHKAEKKQAKMEKKGIKREKTAALSRNEFLERLTRAPIVFHPNSEFNEMRSYDSGATDIMLQNITMEVAGSVMLDEANLTIVSGRRYGLVGRNGVGKTTFLKHLVGKVWEGVPDNLHILHIEQEVQGSDVTVLQTILNTDVEREALLKEERELSSDKPGDGEATGANSGDRLAYIYQRLEEIDAASAPSRAAKILSGLGFTDADMTRPTSDFSGGWRMRVSLAMALFIMPDVLLLDEPTNHLDLHAVLWLEDFLQGWKKTLLIVSHSRDFLDNVATDIIHMQDQKLTRYKGNYTNFEEMRQTLIKQNEKQLENQERERAHIQKFIDKNRVRAATASMAQSRIKALEKMSKVEAIVQDPSIQFNFPNPERLSGQALIQLVDVGFAWESRPDKILFKGVDLSVNADSKVCLVGPNGVGKSTIMKLMMGDMEPTSGLVRRHGALRCGRFSQHFVEQLNLQKSPLETFQADYPKDPIQKIRAHLGSMGVTGKLALQPIYTLSGGQKARVALARITYEEPHMLVLDEPTNHLDLETVQALIMGLLNFEGGVFVISHDTQMISAVCNELWVMEDQKCQVWKGDFDGYRKHVLNQMKGRK